MRLSHVDVCNAVLTTGSVTAAARILCISQPAVSKALQSAENRLGFKLFSRDRNRLVPTREAMVIQPELAELAARLERLHALAKAMRSDASAPLRIDCVPSLTGALLGPAMKRFAAAHPQVVCHLETHAHADIHERLLRRQCDIGFALERLAKPGLIEETVAQALLVCAAPENTFSRDKHTLTRADLHDCRLPQFEVPDADVAARPAPTTRAGISVTNHLLALRLVEQGLGVAVIDEFTARSAGPRVQVLPLVPEQTIELTWLRRADTPLSHLASRFVQAMRAAAGQDEKAHTRRAA
jgi:DNA-binding transcriptional LysR family regulator